MSRRSGTSLKPSSIVGCKVCKDAGDPECVWATHIVRTDKGKISCPRLLASTCHKCGNKGHTKKWCKAGDMNMSKLIDRMSQRSKQVEVAFAPVSTPNVFAALGDTSSEDEEEAPANVTLRLKPVQKHKSWADMSDDDDDDDW